MGCRMERTISTRGRGGGASMITYSAEKRPSDPVSCLYECFIYAFLNACMLSFDVIMINNEFGPLLFSRHCFRRPRILFFLAWLIRDAVGYT